MLQECDECGTYNSEYYFDGSCMLCVTKRLENETRLKAENKQLKEACKAALDYLQLPELSWKENLIDIITEFLACCKD